MSSLLCFLTFGSCPILGTGTPARNSRLKNVLFKIDRSLSRYPNTELRALLSILLPHVQINRFLH